MNAAAVTALWALPLVIAWRWRPRGPADPCAWILLAAFGALGAWALWFGLYAHAGEPGNLAPCKPTVLYWTLAAVSLICPLFGWGYPAKIIIGTYFAFSNREWRVINLGLAAMYLALGGANLVLASSASHKDWEGFKFAFMMNLFIIVLFRLNFVWLPILAEIVVHSYRRASAAYRYLASLF